MIKSQDGDKKAPLGAGRGEVIRQASLAFDLRGVSFIVALRQHFHHINNREKPPFLLAIPHFPNLFVLKKRN
ncbi:hypothetical protein IKE86_02560 [Candidatus Saccharibacteria bacterium]|nr:hypothetical protein [Candidatus Saccharibacteria bacterium]